MTELELLQIIGYAQDVHVLDADEMPVKRKIIPFSKPLIRSLAAIFALVLAIGLFLQTPVGVAAAEVVKEQIERFLDILFPPKELVVYLEGEPETIPHEALGREPESNTPGFAIYVDTDSYSMTQDGDAWFIRPNPIPFDREEIRSQQKALLEGLSSEEQERAIDERIAELKALYEALPPVEMEIREMPHLAPIPAAKELHAQMEGKWENLTEMWSVWLEGQREGMCFYANQGTAWDAPHESHYFLDNGAGGCYHVTCRYYQEASEGHGTRFTAMVQTFSIAAPQDLSGYSTIQGALQGSMEQEIAYAKERSDALLTSQEDSAGWAVERSGLWQDVHSKLWTSLEQTLDEDTMADVTFEHFVWATERRAALDEVRKELGHSEITTMNVYRLDGDLLEERTEILLAYLQGAAQPSPRPEGVDFSPDEMIAAFIDAYFRGDRDTMRLYLTSNLRGVPNSYPMDGELVVNHTTKGLQDLSHTMTKLGYLPVSVEFRETPDSDTYTYLSISVVWENDHWAIRDYGLER